MVFKKQLLPLLLLRIWLQTWSVQWTYESWK